MIRFKFIIIPVSMDLEQLRQKWQGLDSDHSLDVENISYINEVKTHSRIGRLRRYFAVMSVVALLWVALFPIVLWNMEVPRFIIIYGAVFFAVMGVMIIFVYRSLKVLDPGRQTVVEALQTVCRVQVLRRIHRQVGYLMALPLLAVMIYYFYMISMPMFYGGLAGAVIGLCIGVVNDRKASRLIASIRSELEM